MYRCYVPNEEGCWAPAVHTNCLHNELAALGLRTMGPTPSDPPDMGRPGTLVGEGFRQLRILARKLNVEKMTLKEVAASYKGKLGVRYREALLSLDEEWLTKGDCKLSAFVKGEKFDPGLKVSKPRIINPRSPRYNLILASYLKPLEHALWSNWKVGHLCKPSRVSGKGLNSRQRAELIESKMSDVGDCMVVEVDGKAFEAHVTRAQLLLEQSVYKAAFPGSRELRELLAFQLQLAGRTSGGVKYKRDGCRASGDFNTGLGNTLLMGTFTICAMQTLNIPAPWTVLADGDNCLLFFRREWLAKVRDCFGATLSGICGHEMTIEKPVDVLEKVVFGQSSPVRFGDGLAMVRNPYKVLSGAFCGYLHYNQPAFAPRLMKAVADAEASLSKGLPVLGPYFQAARAILRPYKSLRNPSDFLDGHLLGPLSGPEPLTITDEARVSFETAFGIGVTEQVAMEQRLVSGLRDELPRVLAEARWTKHLVEVTHGKGVTRHDNTMCGL